MFEESFLSPSFCGLVVSPIRLLPVPVAASPQSKPNDRNEFNDFVAYLCGFEKKVALHLLLFALDKLSEAFQKVKPFKRATSLEKDHQVMSQWGNDKAKNSLLLQTMQCKNEKMRRTRSCFERC